MQRRKLREEGGSRRYAEYMYICDLDHAFLACLQFTKFCVSNDQFPVKDDSFL